MGLAASQARFLAITSRKMNCEFQSMQIAQDKLSVTRDLQSAATKYQNAMNATKLVWDTDSDEVYDSSYDLMMTPSALNDYNPYLITDTQGKIVLSDSMFKAAQNAGIIDENGDPIAKSGNNPDSVDIFTKEYRDKFLYGLVSAGDLTLSTYSIIQGIDYTKSGIGGEPLDKTIANALSTTAFINRLGDRYQEDVKDPNNESNILHKKGDNVYGLNLVDILGEDNICPAISPTDINSGKLIITENGNALSNEALKDISLGDLLTGTYSMTIINGSIDDAYQKVLEAIAKTLGWNNSGAGLNVDAESNSALNNALELTKADTQDVVYNVQKFSGTPTVFLISDMISKSSSYNGVISGESHNKQFQTISLTNLLKAYLTNFAIAIDGVSDTPFNIAANTQNSVYITEDPNYYFLLGTESSVTETDVLTADFYNQLYNQICTNGATTDAIKRGMVKDPEYLMQALKNGQLFISSLNTDGYFYQGAYTLNGYVAEVTDEEAIAQAEMEYEITKSKLNYKEETLDLKMKNIDTELSALTTEYDTVKNLISKNVEKVFTMFST